MSNFVQQEQKYFMENRRLWDMTMLSKIDNLILAALDTTLISVYLLLHQIVHVDGWLNKCCFKHWNLNEPAKLNVELQVL